jgi:hypothetical protein
MAFPFDFTALTQRISDMLARVMRIGITVPGSGGFHIPLWFVIVIAAVVFFVATNLIHKRD